MSEKKIEIGIKNRPLRIIILKGFTILNSLISIYLHSTILIGSTFFLPSAALFKWFNAMQSLIL